MDESSELEEYVNGRYVKRKGRKKGRHDGKRQRFSSGPPNNRMFQQHGMPN